MVEVKFNPWRIISHYYNNRFALQYAYIHNFCPDSKHTWLYSLNTRIYTLEYNAEKSKDKITIHFIILWYNKLTQQSEHRDPYRSLYFSILLQTTSEL
jgi:hypothetical protein